MTLKDFEAELTRLGMTDALDLLAKLRGPAKRIAKPRPIVSRKVTPALAAGILDLHRATTMTQHEIAQWAGVNQGRVNEVIKRGKWL